MSNITIENIREEFESLVNKLNELNDFCSENNINFQICHGKDNYNSIYWQNGDIFELTYLAQTIEKQL